MKSEPIIPIRENKSFKDSGLNEIYNVIPDTISVKLIKPLRLLNINGTYLYAQPQQILLVEASDHMVVVYLSAGDKIKKAIRHVSLGDMEKLLPDDLFHRVNRYCIINVRRLSGANLDTNELEYDMFHNIKAEHPLPAIFFRRFGM